MQETVPGTGKIKTGEDPCIQAAQTLWLTYTQTHIVQIIAGVKVRRHSRAGVHGAGGPEQHRCPKPKRR